LTTKIPFLSNKRPAILVMCLVAAPLFFVLDNVFQISGPVLELLGRDATLTNRTEIWTAVKAHPVDPVLGCGYLNFWDKIGSLELDGNQVDLKTAHNGYLEIYLDGGIVGLSFLAIMLLNVAFKKARAFAEDWPAAGLILAYFCMTLLNNISESMFARRGPLWSAFLMSSFGLGLFAPWASDKEPKNANSGEEQLPLDASLLTED
jgi:O-antigen ligase